MCNFFKPLSCVCHAGKTAFDAPRWGPNLLEFVKRFDSRYTAGEGPKRLKNMYFTYLVEMRALVKAAPYLLQVGVIGAAVVVVLALVALALQQKLGTLFHQK